MAWTTPTTRSTGYLVTAAVWNADLVDNLSYLKGLAGDVTIEDDMILQKSTDTLAWMQFKTNSVIRGHIGWSTGGIGMLVEAGTSSFGNSNTFLQLLPGAAGLAKLCSGGGVEIQINSDDSTDAFFSIFQGSGPSELHRFTAQGLVCFNDTTNANMTQGLTINQGANDNQSLALKSSGDVAHGLITAGAVAAETDDYLTFQKAAAATGGATIAVFGENAAVNNNLLFASYGGQASATKSVSGRAMIEMFAAQHDGANALADIAADGNVFSVRARRGGATVTLMIIDEDGDAHNDGTGWTAYDEHDDVRIANLVDMAVGGVDPVKAGFAAFLDEHRHELQRLKLVSFDEAGHPFVNTTKMQCLLVGAVRQLGARVEALERRLLAA